MNESLHYVKKVNHNLLHAELFAAFGVKLLSLSTDGEAVEILLKDGGTTEQMEQLAHLIEDHDPTRKSLEQEIATKQVEAAEVLRSADYSEVIDAIAALDDERLKAVLQSLVELCYQNAAVQGLINVN